MPPRKKYYSAYCLKCGIGHNKAFGYCLVPNCGGTMGTEGQLIKKEREKCNHILGYSSGDFIYKSSYIIHPNFAFKYCPMCGQKLKEYETN